MEPIMERKRELMDRFQINEFEYGIYEYVYEEKIKAETYEQEIKNAEKLYNKCFGDTKENYAKKIGKKIFKNENLEGWHLYVNKAMRSNASKIQHEPTKKSVGEYPRIEIAEWFIKEGTYRDIYEIIAHEIAHVIRELMIDRSEIKKYKVHDEIWTEIAKKYNVENTVCLKKKFFLENNGMIRRMVREKIEDKLEEPTQKLSKWLLKCKDGCEIRQERWNDVNKPSQEQRPYLCKDHGNVCTRYIRNTKGTKHELYKPSSTKESEVSESPTTESSESWLKKIFGFGFSSLEPVYVEDGDILDGEGKSLVDDICITDSKEIEEPEPKKGELKKLF